MRQIIYVGSHKRVEMPTALPGVVIERHADAVEVTDQLADELIARGDFIELVPEPPAKPVQRTPRKTTTKE